ncbi:hypothetical protein D9613_012968 [Agrocybe pediades]|uniref:Uncharacterized protein n=1 Tax=Agrocybe pediades TaxID=84607 RepID=A0A8H4VIS6_9AGAR|nr:hypothetical protein D9613_012968 [Agrocybe pediades]
MSRQFDDTRTIVQLGFKDSDQDTYHLEVERGEEAYHALGTTFRETLDARLAYIPSVSALHRPGSRTAYVQSDSSEGREGMHDVQEANGDEQPRHPIKPISRNGERETTAGQSSRRWIASSKDAYLFLNLRPLWSFVRNVVKDNSERSACKISGDVNSGMVYITSISASGTSAVNDTCCWHEGHVKGDLDTLDSDGSYAQAPTPAVDEGRVQGRRSVIMNPDEHILEKMGDMDGVVNVGRSSTAPSTTSGSYSRRCVTCAGGLLDCLIVQRIFRSDHDGSMGNRCVRKSKVHVLQ